MCRPSLCSGLVLRPAGEVQASFERDKEGSRVYGWPHDRALIPSHQELTRGCVLGLGLR